MQFHKESLLIPKSAFPVFPVDGHIIVISPDKPSASAEFLGELFKIDASLPECGFEAVVEIATIDKNSDSVHFSPPRKNHRGLRFLLIPWS